MSGKAKAVAQRPKAKHEKNGLRMMFGGRSNMVEKGRAGHAPGSTLRPRRSRVEIFQNGRVGDHEKKRTDGTLRFMWDSRFVLIFAPFVLGALHVSFCGLYIMFLGLRSTAYILSWFRYWRTISVRIWIKGRIILNLHKIITSYLLPQRIVAT